MTIRRFIAEIALDVTGDPPDDVGYIDDERARGFIENVLRSQAPGIPFVVQSATCLEFPS